MTVSDCFRILELPRNAGIDDLKFAYRAKAKKYHPDRKGGDSRKFTRLHEAYTFLLDYGPFKNGPLQNGTAFQAEQEKMRREARDRRAAEEKLRREAREARERQAAEEKLRREAREARERKITEERLKREARRKAAEKLKKDNPVHQAHLAGDILSSPKSDREKLKAIQTLVNLKRKSVYPYLKKGFYNSSEKIIIASIEAVGKLRIVQAGPEFSSLMCSGSPQIRKAVIDAISSFSGLRTFKDIIEMGLNDRDKEIRTKSEKLRSRLNG